jgi:hypothetical protein
VTDHDALDHRLFSHLGRFAVLTPATGNARAAHLTAAPAARGSLTALLFRLEQRHDPARLVPLVDAAIGWFGRHSGFAALKSAFAALAARTIAAQGDTGVAVPGDLPEVRSILATRVEEWKQRWRVDALRVRLEEGRQEGCRDGLREGEAAILLRQLE